MNPGFSPEVAQWRSALRAWLEREMATLPRRRDMLTWTWQEHNELRREWQLRLWRAGYVAVDRPAEHGGQGLSVEHHLALELELDRHFVPETYNLIGLGMVGPTILAWGSEEQKRELVGRIPVCEDVWCQGFSEPEAGSDLASLRTRAVWDDDAWVVRGQKLWTSRGHYANKGILLARTGDEGPPHRQITCFVLDMSAPGITLDPIIEMTGEYQFNTMFLDDVRIPPEAVVGPLNQGWTVAMTTLGFERLHTPGSFGALLRDTLAKAPPAARTRLAALWSRIQILQWNQARGFTDLHRNVASPTTTILKLYWSELHEELTGALGDAFGADAMVWDGDGGVAGFELCKSRGTTIYAGTSEIQRNIIAERALGLPR